MGKIYCRIVTERDYGFSLLESKPIPKWLIYAIGIKAVTLYGIPFFIDWEAPQILVYVGHGIDILAIVYMMLLVITGIQIEKEIHFRFTSRLPLTNRFWRWLR